LLGVFCCEWRFTCGFWKSLNVAMYVVVVYCEFFMNSYKSVTLIAEFAFLKACCSPLVV
jgi:hypothetical protein